MIAPNNPRTTKSSRSRRRQRVSDLESLGKFSSVAATPLLMVNNVSGRLLVNRAHQHRPAINHSAEARRRPNAINKAEASATTAHERTTWFFAACRIVTKPDWPWSTML